MIIKGFKFGMLLQLAVGPMCLMVFNTSASGGFIMGFTLAAAIALIDALYISLSGLGVASIINKPGVKKVIKLFGFIVLVLFGINTILGAFNFSLLPSASFFTNIKGQSIFIQGLLLTASNPLTIIFWSGVFSSQVVENDYNFRQLFFFGLGSILSTISFMTAVAAAGSMVNTFLPELVIQVFNIAVGIVLIIFGFKLLLSDREKRKSESGN